MKVLYDWQAFTRKYSGISKCFVELISNLPETTEWHISIKDCNNFHLLEKKLCNVNTNVVNRDNFITDREFLFKKKLYRTVEKLFPNLTSEGRNFSYSVECLVNNDYDVFHPTYFNEYFLKYIGKKPFILTVHDMIPETFPGYFKHDSQSRKKQHLAELASHIVAVSERTKSDLIRFFGLPEEKISVVYHGSPDILPYYKEKIFDFNYLLHIGERSRYKNFGPMLIHLAPFLRTHKEIKLVCTHDNFVSEEQKLIEKLGLKDSVVHVFADDVQLQNLYANALCFLQPSLAEGFCIPILEAYRCKCPVFLNNKSVFPEIAQDAAIFFELDDDKQNLTEKLEEFLNFTSSQKEDLIKKQSERLELFSWKKSAEKLNDIYKSVI